VETEERENGKSDFNRKYWSKMK